MGKDGYTKYQVKIQGGRSGSQLKWAHLGYISDELKERFDKNKNKKGWDNNRWVEKWAWEDFELMQIHKTENFELLKNKIQDMYKRIYPEIYVSTGPSGMDRQGWSRVWVTAKMMRELNYKWPGREHL